MITREEALRTARLAMLTFTPEETDELIADLSRILEYAQKIGEIDTSGVEPMTRAVETPVDLREDEPGECLTIEETLSNAPDPHGRLFRTQRVI